jgi:glyoxylase-like metal-dependent hydrolase (beta-lactamase superfamily II)
MVSTNCYIVFDPETREAAVIDPGCRSDLIIDSLTAHKLTAKYIFLTHSHFDHVLALEKVRGATGAKSVAHEDENTETDVRVRGGEFFPLGGHSFEVLHTPGHTPGSVCYKADTLLFTGDTLFKDWCGRCDLPGGDYGVMLRSLRRLAELEGDFAVYPGHDEPTSLSRERAHNSSMRESLNK